jgi:hypothetical protein
VTSGISRSVGAQSFGDAPLVTSGISRSVEAQSLEGAYRGRVCVRVFIGVSVRAVVSVWVVLCNFGVFIIPFYSLTMVS